MKIIKRNGEEQDFSPEKIRRVIRLANQSVQGTDRIKTTEDEEKVFHYVIESLSGFGTVSVETVQDKIRDAFMNFNYFEVADSFIKFRQDKKAQKKFTETEEKIISICNYTNEAVKQDNANKNPRVLAVQRDYISGEECKKIGKKVLPKDIVEGHNKGLIHFHDLDYSPVQKMSNCCLVNYKDMAENGFAMNGTPIHKTTQGFKTECTLASQVAAQTAGQQYGGQTMSWAHIAKSIQTSRLSLIEEVVEEDYSDEDGNPIFQFVRNEDTKAEDYYEYLSLKLSAAEVENIKRKVELRIKREIKSGVKTFQYQVLTILCSNGQTPFISMSMNLEDCEGDKQWEADTKLVFEEVLKQRIKGIPDKHGNLVPVVFPKLLYFLDERNHSPETENWYLTKLAAESAAKTMAPDFISAKVQKKVKHTNHTWPCMGAARGDGLVSIKTGDTEYKNIPIQEAYKVIAKYNNIENPFETNREVGYTTVHKVHGCYAKSGTGWDKINYITYNSKDTCTLKLFEVRVAIDSETASTVVITEDHPLVTRRGRVVCKDLVVGDEVYLCDEKSTGIIESISGYDIKEDTYDFSMENDKFNLNGLWSHNCRSFATPYTPDPLYDDEKVAFNRGYKEIFTVKELYEMSKKDNNSLKFRMFLRLEGYYKGDVNEIDHFEEENGRIKLVCRPKYWGFFNGGVVTINVPHVALESHGNKAEFWRILDQRCELAYRALVKRYESLKDAPSDAAPILRQNGGLMRLNDDETWNHMIVGPRCTYSLGYVGLWETQLYMTGKKLTEDQSFANEILNFFNKKHDEWHTRLMDSKDPNSWLNTSTYGTPEENLVQKFSDSLKRDFGEVEGVTDHDYVTNSYHVDPAQPIDWANKIVIEAKMMDKSTGGAISYIELPDMTKNIEAVESMIQYMYDHILYCELNVKRDICYRCGFRGTIKIVEDNGKHVWECPACRNRNTAMMFIRRRVCGYIGDANTGAAQARMGDYKARVEHTDVPMIEY